MGFEPTISRVTWCSPRRIVGSGGAGEDVSAADILCPWAVARATVEQVTAAESCERNSLRPIPGASCPSEFILASYSLESGMGRLSWGLLTENADLRRYHFPDRISGLLTCSFYPLQELSQ
jgi:hypothetical protein